MSAPVTDGKESFDYHLTYDLAMSRAVPSVTDCRGIPAIETVSAGGKEAPEREERYCEAVWQANWAVARAYGLTPANLEHILATFPVSARKRP